MENSLSPAKSLVNHDLLTCSALGESYLRRNPNILCYKRHAEQGSGSVCHQVGLASADALWLPAEVSPPCGSGRSHLTGSKPETIHATRWRPAYAIRHREKPLLALELDLLGWFAIFGAVGMAPIRSGYYTPPVPALAWTEIISTAVGGIVFLALAGIIRGLHRIEQAIRETRKS
jgi:hypothetical protein